MADGFRYILRYYIDPGWEEESRIAELVEFCREGRIEEVMLFFNPEELFTGHVTWEELAPWRSLAGRVKRALAAAGVALSLNPWITTAHLSRGRRLKPDQSFRPMTGENGVEALITACPLDEAWRDYLTGLWGRLAAELDPCAIWIEDDFRLHNHDPEQGWGGCFCAEHLRRFARLIGRDAVTREELLANLLAPGKPHPWRALWMGLWRDTMLETMACLAARVDCRLGLMSSDPDTHSIEGRDWIRLTRSMAKGGAVLSRPHLPPYTEARLLDSTPSVARQTVSRLPRPIEVYPELESGLRCGWYSRSPEFSLFQCFQSALFGSRGITINHFDMMGCGTAMDDGGFASRLAQAKPALSALTALKLDDDAAAGITVLDHPDAAAHLELAKAESSMGALHAHSIEWSRAFYTLGIAHRIAHRVETGRGPYAACGQSIRAYTDAEIAALLSGTLLVDAAALEALAERVGPAALGLKKLEWRRLNDDAFAYEEFLEDDPSVYGVARPRVSAQMCADRALKLDLLPQAQALSMLRDPWHRELYPGFYQFATPSGGRLIAMAYCANAPGSNFHVGFHTRFRRIFLQRLLCGDGVQVYGTNLPLQVSAVECDGNLVVAAFNINTATIDRIDLAVHGFAVGGVSRLGADGVWVEAGAELSFAGPFAPLAGVILKLKK